MPCAGVQISAFENRGLREWQSLLQPPGTHEPMSGQGRTWTGLAHQAMAPQNE